MVLFDVSAHRGHQVTPVTGSLPRYSLNVWFHDPEAA
jgi:hypothetical protein